MGYVAPAKAPITDNYQAHLRRNSAEPGTDYATPYGTNVKVAEAGKVTYVDTNPNGADGRRVTVHLNDGRQVSYIHLSAVNVSVGDNVSRGQTIAKSGASGFGRDWYYGPHVHVTLHKAPGMAYKNSIDFERYVGDAKFPSYPLPNGYYFGPKEGPKQSVSGYYSYRDGLRQWQQRMKDRGWGITVDGLYGPNTRKITIAFQKEKGLTVDGLIGHQTWNAAWTKPIT